jgi:(2Fe-2S) ferredoxin
MKAEFKKQGLGAQFRCNESGCLDQCEYGPTMVLYPQGIWYGRVKEADVPRIVAETVIGGRILEDLVIPPECLNTKGKVPWNRPSDSKSPGGDHC